MHMTKYHKASLPTGRSQSGVGLMEVLVAVVLLAVGVLGFSVLQVRAVGATSESMNRTQAMNIIRDMGERIRENAQSYTAYTTQLKASIAQAGNTPPSKQCQGTKTGTVANACTATERAQYDAYQLKLSASQTGNAVGLVDCPGLQAGMRRMCAIIAWNKTTPTLGADGAKDCLSAAGQYYPAASCLMMESL